MPKSLLLPFFALLALLGYTANELRFAISHETPLSEAMMKNVEDLSYTQFYRLETKLKYRVDIANQDKTMTATLLWPEEPFTRILVLAKNDGDSLNTQRAFTGQLERCVYRCLPGGMFIQMDDFLQMIETKFPVYKDQPKLMPTMVLNTLVAPVGFVGYLKEFRWYYATIAVLLVGAVVYEIVTRFKKRTE
jgi:hypothetical protein